MVDSGVLLMSSLLPYLGVRDLAIPGGAWGLFLALHSAVTPGGAVW